MPRANLHLTARLIVLALGIAGPSGGGAEELQLAALEGHAGSVNAVAFSPDGKTLASGGSDKVVRLWDVATRTERQTLAGHSEAITSIAFNRDGRTLASGSTDRSLRIWDAASGKGLAALGGEVTGVLQLAMSDDGKTLASAHIAAIGHSAIKLWDVASAKERLTLDIEGKIYGLAISPADGNIVALTPWIKSWDAANGAARQPPGKVASARACAFSQDGKLLAMGMGFPARNDDILLEDVETGQERAHWYPKLWDIAAMAFSPDGKLLVAGGSNFSHTGIWLVDLETGNEIRTQHLPKVRAVAFSPDSKTLAICDNGPTIRLLAMPAAK